MLALSSLSHYCYLSLSHTLPPSSLEKVREEIAVRLYPKRVILIRHAEVSKALTPLSLSLVATVDMFMLNV